MRAERRCKGERRTCPAPAAIAVRDLLRTFSRDGRTVDAIQDFSLEFGEGEFVSVVGPSGCGKSASLHMVGGIESVTKGQLLVCGKPVQGPGPDRAVIFQEFALALSVAHRIR